LAPSKIGQTFDSTAWLPVKLVECLFLMTGDKLNYSDKLKTVLLSGYKVLGY
jgi:hypothetical protein